MASENWLTDDFYKALGVSEDASESDIKKAYRKLSRKYHPDLNPGDAAAEKKFKEISEAYDVLSDKKQREEYDQIRRYGASGMGGFGGGGFGGGSYTGYPGADVAPPASPAPTSAAWVAALAAHSTRPPRKAPPAPASAWPRPTPAQT